MPLTDFPITQYLREQVRKAVDEQTNKGNKQDKGDYFNHHAVYYKWQTLNESYLSIIIFFRNNTFDTGSV